MVACRCLWLLGLSGCLCLPVAARVEWLPVLALAARVEWLPVVVCGCLGYVVACADIHTHTDTKTEADTDTNADTYTNTDTYSGNDENTYTNGATAQP